MIANICPDLVAAYGGPDEDPHTFRRIVGFDSDGWPFVVVAGEPRAVRADSLPDYRSIEPEQPSTYTPSATAVMLAEIDADPEGFDGYLRDHGTDSWAEALAVAFAHGAISADYVADFIGWVWENTWNLHFDPAVSRDALLTEDEWREMFAVPGYTELLAPGPVGERAHRPQEPVRLWRYTTGHWHDWNWYTSPDDAAYISEPDDAAADLETALVPPDRLLAHINVGEDDLPRYYVVDTRGLDVERVEPEDTAA